MKKVLIFGALLALICCGFAGVAKADVCDPSNCITNSSGITYTFTSSQDGSDPAGVWDVTLVINSSGAITTGNITSFAIQFGNDTNVALETAQAEPEIGYWRARGRTILPGATLRPIRANTIALTEEALLSVQEEHPTLSCLT